jgi:hypothetical protein
LTLAPLGNWSRRARAADIGEAPAAEAKRHYEEGTKAFNLGEFSRAIAEFKAAYNAKPDPLLLYNIAQSYRLAGDPAQALFFYRSFLRNMPDAPNRKEIEGRIRTLEKQVDKQDTERRREPHATAPSPVPLSEPGGSATSPPPAGSGADRGSPTSGGTATTPGAPSATTPDATPGDPATRDQTWGWHRSPAAGSASSSGSPGRTPSSGTQATTPAAPPVVPSPRRDPDIGTTLGTAREAAPPAEPASEPLSRRWWFWPAIGGTALVVLLGLAAAARRPPDTDLGIYDAVNWEPVR